MAAAEGRQAALERQLAEARSATAAAEQVAEAEADSRGAALTVSEALREQLLELSVGHPLRSPPAGVWA